jgi:antitoxin component YwqK of YwqJK toxin-antitoxin module
MKALAYLLIFTMSLFSGCGKTDKGQNNKTETDTGIAFEYHANGKIKTEISVVGQLRNGVTKNYDNQGRLLSEVNYTNNVREGMAKNYYAKSGKLNSTLEYKNGIKTGNEIWYYESGQAYRVSPFVNGKIAGIQKLYYQNGSIKAEVPYQEGYPGIGLKEYNKDGSLKTGYPKIIISKEDYLKTANKILLRISLSNNSSNVKFYKGKLKDGFLHSKAILLVNQNGVAQVDYNIPSGTSIKESIVISCNYKTPSGNPCVLSRTYSFEVNNN